MIVYEYHFLKASIYLVFFTSVQFDLIFVDQVSHSIPLLKRFCSKKVLFYCHYPDMLLSPPGGRLKKLYRAPLDSYEEYSTGAADVVMVNSGFTKEKSNIFNVLYYSIPLIFDSKKVSFSKNLHKTWQY